MIEKGFFHPVEGYRQIIGEPTQDILASFPTGTIEVPLKPGADYEWNGAEWVHVPPDPQELLEAERSRMVASRFQAKAALALAGLLETAEAAIAGSGDPVTQLAWAEAVEFRRFSPSILKVAALLSLSDETVDDLFRRAMEIEA